MDLLILPAVLVKSLCALKCFFKMVVAPMDANSLPMRRKTHTALLHRNNVVQVSSAPLHNLAINQKLTAHAFNTMNVSMQQYESAAPCFELNIRPVITFDDFHLNIKTMHMTSWDLN